MDEVNRLNEIFRDLEEEDFSSEECEECRRILAEAEECDPGAGSGDDLPAARRWPWRRPYWRPERRDSLPPEYIQAWTHVLKGDYEVALKDITSVLNSWGSGITSNSRNPEYSFFRAAVRLCLGDRAGAKADLEAVAGYTQMKPDWKPGWPKRDA